MVPAGSIDKIGVCGAAENRGKASSRVVANYPRTCGRYGFFTRPSGIASRLGATVDESLPFVPRYNIAATQPVMAITNDDARSLVASGWGLVPRRATSSEVRLSTFNARIETIATAPAIRESTRERRGVILADGFYEWRKNADGSKTPLWIHSKDGVAFLRSLASGRLAAGS